MNVFGINVAIVFSNNSMHSYSFFYFVYYTYNARTFISIYNIEETFSLV